MEHVEVPFETYLQETLQRLPGSGLLLATAGADGSPNAMTIGWGTIGIIWGRPIFTVLVRPSRYTYELLQESDSFTVCVPGEDLLEAVSFCGSRSGRDCDKLKELDLAVLPSTRVSAPGIAQCPIVYECRVVHTTNVVPASLSDEITGGFYGKGDFHRIYHGEIVAVRALPDAADLLAG